MRLNDGDEPGQGWHRHPFICSRDRYYLDASHVSGSSARSGCTGETGRPETTEQNTCVWDSDKQYEHDKAGTCNIAQLGWGPH